MAGGRWHGMRPTGAGGAVVLVVPALVAIGALIPAGLHAGVEGEKPGVVEVELGELGYASGIVDALHAGPELVGPPDDGGHLLGGGGACELVVAAAVAVVADGQDEAVEDA